MRPTLSPDIISVAVEEAGNRSMRRAGREGWSDADHRAARRESQRLYQYFADEVKGLQPLNERKLPVKPNDPKMVDITMTEQEKAARRQSATLGPWEVCQMTQADGSPFLAVKNVDEGHIAVCLVAGMEFVDAEDAGNAYLIAAAPTMLELLEKYVALCDGDFVQTGDESRLLKKVREVIASTKPS